MKPHGMLICLFGAQGAGKTTVANTLTEHFGFIRVPIAAPLRRMLLQIGLSEQDLQEGKRVPHHLLGGKTPMFAMQTLGTEWGRQLISENLWAHVWRSRVCKLLPSSNVVCDDLRFPNEYDIADSLNAKFWLIEGRALPPSSHKSETYWKSFAYHTIFDNSGDLSEIFRNLKELLNVHN